MDKRCNNCRNRIGDPRWCPGCWYNFPGLEQFDFYQPIQHSVLMVEKNGPAQAKYENVASCEHKDSRIVLTLSNQETASFPDDGSWLMFDFTPTAGWNENPGVIPEPKGMRQVKIQLVRHRASEDSTWVNNLYLVMDEVRFNARGKSHWEDPAAVKDKLLKIVQSWLQTKQGWKANAATRFDFNWGDLVDVLPIEAAGVTLASTANDRLAINAETAVGVDQDEHLAPDAVPAILNWEDGSRPVNCFVDFQKGRIYAENPDQKIPRYNTKESIQLQNDAMETFLVHWDAIDKAYYLALEQPK